MCLFPSLRWQRRWQGCQAPIAATASAAGPMARSGPRRSWCDCAVLRVECHFGRPLVHSLTLSLCFDCLASRADDLQALRRLTSPLYGDISKLPC